MASNRHLGRIIAMQTLYEFDFRSSHAAETKPNLAEILDRNLAVYAENVDDTDFVQDLVTGTHKNEAKIDGLIAPAAPDWPIDQIAKIDRAVLRLAIYELVIRRDVPPKVAINEAVELAKAFGGDNSSRFVNGVLGTIYRQSDFYEPEEDKKPAAKPPKPVKSEPDVSETPDDAKAQK